MSNEHWGSDLHLLDDLTKQNDRNRGEDLETVQRDETRQIDLATYIAEQNLIQALLLRLLTPMGEMEALGHPNYGCRLHELTGQLNNETTRNRAKMFILQAIAGEARIEKVLSVSVEQNIRDKTRMDIDISFKAIRSNTPLNLVFPFFLERGTAP